MSITTQRFKLNNGLINDMRFGSLLSANLMKRLTAFLIAKHSTRSVIAFSECHGPMSCVYIEPQSFEMALKHGLFT